ncbi:hypothetical protein [Bifidobacterium subtile]|jgi:hypothetical protein|uniref:hypothetical protein n=1 Tax=Bifidobacterium subtile TaxID=77635 RepID=UPI002F35E51B
MNTYITLAAQLADLTSIYSTLVQHYLGPVVIIGAAVFSLWFFIKKQPRPLLVSLATALLTAVILYAAPAIMGQQSTLVKNGSEIAKQIN